MTKQYRRILTTIASQHRQFVSQEHCTTLHSGFDLSILIRVHIEIFDYLRSVFSSYEH